jgi:flagellar hook-associated protein 1
MANLFSTMRSAAMALDAFQRVASASQNNVSNSSTPGYARQRVMLAARAYDADQNLSGGVTVQRVQSSRDEFAEQTVRQQTSDLAAAEEKAQRLSILEGNFDLSDTASIAARMDEMYAAANAWSVAPQGITEKTNFIVSAKNVAASFRKMTQALQQAGGDAEVRMKSVLTRIGDLAERVRQHNVEVYAGGMSAAGSMTTVHADLEELAQFVDYQALWHNDGSVTLLVGKQTALVSGMHRYNFSIASDPTAPDPGLEGAIPRVRVIDEAGADVTRTFTSGEFGALLDVRNNTIPGLAGSVTQPGDLNRLAKAFADRVNEIFAEGLSDPSTAVKIFTYSGLGSAAQSIAVPDSVTTGVLTADNPAAAGPKANARALAVAALANPSKSSDKIDGLSYVSFFGTISSAVGRAANEATAFTESRRQLHAQALSAREQISGVSLDEEAIQLVSIQRAYQATSRMITILDELTRMAVNIGRE